MNDNLQPLGDDHLEARITAYVLGESAPFESAELEALIESSPELKLFANRIRTLHTLMQEAETTSNESSEEWKLPAGIRNSLEHILGPTPDADHAKERRIRRVAFHSAIGIAAVLLLTVFSAPMVIRQRKKADQAGMRESQLAVSVPQSIDGSGKDLDQLRSAIREQEEKVEERRKVLTTSSRTKDIIYRGDRDTAGRGELDEGSLAKLEPSKQESKKAALERSIDTQDYADAKKDLESDQRRLEQLQLKLALEEVATALPGENKALSENGLGPNTRPSIPQAPSSSVSNAIAAKTSPPAIIPVPQVAAAEPPQPFGGGADLGAGWGGGLAHRGRITEAGRKGRESLKAAASSFNEIVTSPGDAAITSAPMDAILKNAASPEVMENLESDSVTPAARPVDGPAAEEADVDAQTDLFAAAPDDNSEGEYATNLPRRLATKLTSAEPALAFGKDVSSHNGGGFGGEALDQTSSLTLDEPTNFGFKDAGATTESEAISGKQLAQKDMQRELQALDKLQELQNPESKSGELEAAQLLMEVPQEQDHLTLKALDSDRTEAEPQLQALAEPQLQALDEAQEQEGKAALGYSSQYLFRGVDLSKEKESAPIELDAKGESDGVAVEEKLRELKAQIEAPGFIMGKKAAIDLADLAQEIPATQEPFSTFSLNISDASFQIARAAIEKGEQPDPEAIKPEQFYNAVDYGDPAPSSLEPVSAAIDQTAHPIIPGRNLVRIGIRTASTGRSAAQPLRLTLLVDQSGSMVRADRRAAMDTALEQLATLLTENDEVTVIGFSRTPRLLADSMKGNEAGKLPALINQTANEGGTNLEEAINLASELALRHKLDGAQNRIVLFTDGAANLGNANPARLSDKIQTLRQQGLAFDIAGIGTNDLNDNLLAELARHGNGRYYLVGENTGASLAAQLAGAFRPAAENVKVQVKLNPQRVGNYKLIGFEKDRLKTEDFRNDSVDAAELAADEAGVAMYQVETLPEGSGEIGEVSVRFRDTASGEMVERTWTIPYESTTPAFDKADPKTQLATLCLLAAQKLQPGPLADAISFRNHSETIARLKQTYANDAKAQQMLNFVNALK